MTEAEARDLLHRCERDKLESLIADQPWEPVPGGWDVTVNLQGWHFRVEPVPGGVRVSAVMPGALPAVWVVTSEAGSNG